MPDKPLTVLTYAASASLAAVALVYLFNPSYLLDAVPGAAPTSDSRFRRGRAVGLSNPANDCFINSILQALTGLNALRDYLVHEIALRDADEEAEDGEGVVYGHREQQPQQRQRREGGEGEEDRRSGEEAVNGHEGSTGADNGTPGSDLEKEWARQAKVRKARSLLHAEVTRGLRVMLEQLNDRSSQRKIISAGPFVQVLESAFATRVNRNQQDAQELLQVVAERMAEEYIAGKQARERAKDEGRDSRKRKRPARQSEEIVDGKAGDDSNIDSQLSAQGSLSLPPLPTTTVNGRTVKDDLDESPEEEGGEETFPLLGQTKHQVECQHCHFIPSSKPTDFIMLTLSVPPKSSATLDECLDQFSKQEFIDDYKCDKCRVQHAIETYEQELTKTKSEDERERLQTGLSKLKIALEKDPENPPKDVQLPDSKLAPTRRIARSVKVTSFPKVLVIHLSRSSFDPTSFSSKNTAKVVFPEILPLGSLVDRRKYRLLGLVTHKGTHYSGHYETFRRVHPTPVSVSELMDENDEEGTSDTGGATARSPTPTPLTSSQTVISPVSPTSNGDADSDVENEALDSMIRSPTAIVTSTGDHGSVSRTTSPTSRKPRRSQQQQPPTKHLSPPSSRPSSSPDTSRTSLATLPTPESVLQQQQQQHQQQQQPQDHHNQQRQDSLTAATATGMERASSRQRMRDRFEEAKGRKREKRLRRVVARENQRWWRISDDRVRECRTGEVLGMQKEGYLLFYEMEA